MLDKRVLSSIVAIPILLFFVISGGIIFKLGVIGVSAIALYEYIGVYKHSKNKVISSVLIFGFLLYYSIIFIEKTSLVLPIIYLIAILSMSIPIFNRSYTVISSALTIIGFIYIINFFSLLILIRDYPSGNLFIWLVFIIAFVSDTFAYYSGRFFGKNKLCPEVSPKKTVEGSIGGILGSVIGVVLWWFFSKSIDFSWYQLIFLGVFGGIVSQIGDLSASLIKRFIGVKDYGNIMPGHGGILDRFDSILFTTPIVYYYIIFFLG
jgi:phosphatidate cytidylyltransferase